MKKVLFAIALLVSCLSTYAQSSMHVNGYTRSNGTYVEGYYRTSPNSTRNDNYSTIGNVNPYKGYEGTKPRDSYSPTSNSWNSSTNTNIYNIPINTPSYNNYIYNKIEPFIKPRY